MPDELFQPGPGGTWRPADHLKSDPPEGKRRTSKAAAKSIKAHVPTMRERCLAHVRKCGAAGATSEETEIALGLRRSTCSARFSKLAEIGQIIDSGRERKTTSNRKATVWIAAGGADG